MRADFARKHICKTRKHYGCSGILFDLSKEWMWGRVKFTGTSVPGLEKASVLLAERVETFLVCVEVKICTCYWITRRPTASDPDWAVPVGLRGQPALLLPLRRMPSRLVLEHSALHLPVSILLYTERELQLLEVNPSRSSKFKRDVCQLRGVGSTQSSTWWRRMENWVSANEVGSVLLPESFQGKKKL